MDKVQQNTPESQLPIGIFDSGVGGLTVMHELMHRLPKESILYLGDTARVPYGNKSPQTIIRYAIECASFLAEKKIKMLVVACNSASAYSLPILRKQLNIPIVDVISPGVQRALELTKNLRIAILGTRATINSKAYQQAIQQQHPKAILYPIACPLLVPLVEEQFLHHPASSLIMKEYLDQLQGKNVDTVLLGCTHYPLAKNLIQKELDTHTTLVDSATTCVNTIATLLSKQQLLNENPSPSYHYYVTDDPDHFQALGNQMIGIPKTNISYIEKL